MDPSRCPAGSTRCAIRRRCSSSCCATSPARCSWCTRAPTSKRAREPDAVAATISTLTTGTFLTATGELKHDERVKLGGLEVKIDELDVAALALDMPIAEDSSVDKRLDYRWIDLRRPEMNLLFRVQTTFLHALRTWWVEHDFVEIQTPEADGLALASRAPSCSRCPTSRPRPTSRRARSTSSRWARPAGFGGCSRSGPAFRADPSFTSRHATEFVSVDAELSWIDSHEDVMAVHEQLLVAGFTAIKQKHGAEIEALFGLEVTVPSVPFPRIPLAEAKEIVAKRGYVVPRADADMDPEGERQISEYVKEEFGHEFVFLTDYASSIRPLLPPPSRRRPGR